MENRKNSKLAYNLRNFARYAFVPRAFYRSKLDEVLKRVDKRRDADTIMERVVYYNQLTDAQKLSNKAVQIKDFHLKGNKSAYFFDTYEHVVYFPENARFDYLFGDVTTVPPTPSIVKSRPICDGNENSILLNLDKCRHFCFVNDPNSFSDKDYNIIFRGDIRWKPRRERFVEMYAGQPHCDIGVVSSYKDYSTQWDAPKLTLDGHLKSKFIMALEGNDVASNLKWVMSSNSLAVMPVPTCETWFMEGLLKPNEHYLCIKEDYSDLPEVTEYYASHPKEAREIIENAHRYVEQFFDREREQLISLLVLKQYFDLTRGED